MTHMNCVLEQSMREVLGPPTPATAIPVSALPRSNRPIKMTYSLAAACSLVQVRVSELFEEAGLVSRGPVYLAYQCC